MKQKYLYEISSTLWLNHHEITGETEKYFLKEISPSYTQRLEKSRIGTSLFLSVAEATTFAIQQISKWKEGDQ